MTDAVVVDAVRTPLGKLRGGLSAMRADDLAAFVLRSILDRVPEANALPLEIVFGATNQAGEDNRNVARMAALLAGLPYEVTGVTVNRLCGSGLDAVIQASRMVRLGEREVVIAGGVESMTRAPFAMERSTEAFPRTPPRVYDSRLGWRFPNPRMEQRFPLLSMGETAEEVAARCHVTREDQDAFAALSHRRAAHAEANGWFARERVPVHVAGAKSEPTIALAVDESIRADTTVESLARLSPVFRSGGTVTAGNSSPMNDGAAAVLVASSAWASARGLRPLARIVGAEVAGVDPSLMGLGPVPATRALLARHGLTVDDLDLVELNEAFAAQALACVRELRLDPARVNVAGGAIALGHPIGCSGARIVATLAHGMQRANARYGLATACIGVGQGIALLLERITA